LARQHLTSKQVLDQLAGDFGRDRLTTARIDRPEELDRVIVCVRGATSPSSIEAYDTPLRPWQSRLVDQWLTGRPRRATLGEGSSEDDVGDSYFLRVRDQTPTRLWINNPTLTEVDLALDQGAVGCTTNPAFASSLLKRQPDAVKPVVYQSIEESEDDDDVVAAVQRALVGPALDRFRPLFDASNGTEGFVSIQACPERDTNGHDILTAALADRALGPNAVPKIPATAPGFEAIDALVAADIPVIVTEVFSLSQLAHACTVYRFASERSGRQPPFFASPITGIFSDRLKVVAAEQRIDVPTSIIDWAGVAFARRCSQVVADEGWPVRLLSGGARTRRDFADLVGRPDSITINYTTVADLDEANPPVTSSVLEPVPDEILSGLLMFEEFRRAIEPTGLTLDEFEHFGPVLHFRSNFVAGWTTVREAVHAARTSSPSMPIV
jgi:transaldolase